MSACYKDKTYLFINELDYSNKLQYRTEWITNQLTLEGIYIIQGVDPRVGKGKGQKQAISRLLWEHKILSLLVYILW